jgi:hypothetical protein
MMAIRGRFRKGGGSDQENPGSMRKFGRIGATDLRRLTRLGEKREIRAPDSIGRRGLQAGRLNEKSAAAWSPGAAAVRRRTTTACVYEHGENEMRGNLKGMCALGALTMIAGAAYAGASNTDVTVTIENLAPQFGTYQTPFWVGFHNGMWDTFNAGEAAPEYLERIAEDGNITPLSMAFNSSGFGALDGVIAPGGPYAPGDIASMTFSLDGSDEMSRYFSFASMVIPSNDAFIGNDNGMAVQIFDDDGSFLGADFFITGAMIWDAGTEVNDEIPENTAFFGQMMPNTGDDENGVVHLHPGYLGSFGNPGTPSILADPMFAGADFTLPGYPVARITITPAPGVLALLGLAGLAGTRRRRNG